VDSSPPGVFRSKVFVPDYIRPDLLLPSVEFPDPLRHETDVHDFCVDDT
jgi:hypothetical protein